MTLSGYVHICAAGETWDSVALAEYGDENYACDLLCANPGLCAATAFEGGEELLLPATQEIEAPGDDIGAAMAGAAPWKEA